MGLFSSKIPTTQMVSLCRQFATSYDAGIPIIQALGIVHGHCRHGRVKSILREMIDDIKHGSSLGDAAGKHGRYFPPFFVQLLAVGEKSGKLDLMLRDLADYYEDRLALQRKIISALIYPCIQLSAAWFIGTFALGMVKQIGLDFNISAYLEDYLAYQLRALAVFGLLFALAIALARFGLLRWVIGMASTFIWPMAPITRRFALARFFRSFSLLLGGGVHIVSAVESAAAVAVNPYIQRDLLKSIPGIRAGRTLAESFAPCKYLTPLAREMLLIGEQSGNLELQCKKIAQYHVQEADHAVKIGLRILTTLIILFMALVIGYIIIKFWTSFYGSVMNELGI